MEALRDIVVIAGGGAGSVAALVRLFGGCPAVLPAAVVLALHLNEEETREAVAALGKRTRMPMAAPIADEAPRAGCIYLSTRGREVHFKSDGLFGLVSRTELAGQRSPPAPSADRLFSTAAAAFQSRVIGVVLSGAADDGTKGCLAIKARGGACIVQSPSDASNPSMPFNVLARDHPDYSVLVDQLGPTVVRLLGMQLQGPRRET